MAMKVEYPMRVALYARVSTGKQAKKELSIPDQNSQMHQWAAAHGHDVVREYIEPGLTATDDNRPEFLKMIAEATKAPAPFDAIIVHSLSRFYRETFGFQFYERKLEKAGVKVISITQETPDDPAGIMMRRIINLFDEYSSKENAKHTLRAMKENARQGNFNGSRPPYGYRVVQVDSMGNAGSKKRLEIHPDEASVVRTIFCLYKNGYRGRPLGVEAIAVHLNQQGIKRRNKPWKKSGVYAVLTNKEYTGVYFFNKKNKEGVLNPEEEWIRVNLPPIIDEQLFEQVQMRLHANAPAHAPPRIVNTPTLLTGLLKCASCGAGMTIATGKSGRYRYYKCQTRVGLGHKGCDCPNIAMEQLDRLVVEVIAERVFTEKRVKSLLDGIKRHNAASPNSQDAEAQRLRRILSDTEAGIDRLHEAVEKGLVPIDEMLQDRMSGLQSRRRELLAQIASVELNQPLPMKWTIEDIRTFCEGMRAVLLLGDRARLRHYLGLLVEEIRLSSKEIEIQGNNAVLAYLVANAYKKMDTSEEVPIFVPIWLPELGSNQRPAD